MAEERNPGESGGVHVHISGGTVHSQNIAGRDIHVGTQISGSELNQVFQPVADAIRSAPATHQPEAMEKLETLKQEAAKGQKADHGLMTRLIDGIVGLAPGALKSLAAAFGTPLLSGVAGPVTQFLLNKLTGQ
jgi:hypothetical protein